MIKLIFSFNHQGSEEGWTLGVHVHVHVHSTVSGAPEALNYWCSKHTDYSLDSMHMCKPVHSCTK